MCVGQLVSFRPSSQTLPRSPPLVVGADNWGPVVRVYSCAHSRTSLSLQRGARCSVLHRVASISLARPPSCFAYLWDPHRQPDSSTRATSARDPPGQSLSFPAANADRLQPNAAVTPLVLLETKTWHDIICIGIFVL
jgi:hypothetical protein